MRLVLPLTAVAIAAQVAQAQTPLSLEDAIGLARRNNALHRLNVNARRSADADLRTAYATLLPSVGASVSGLYQKQGDQFFNGVALGNQSDVLQSSYSVGVSYSINSAVLFAPRLYAANRDAAEADVTLSEEVLRATVTQQYLTVLQAQARAALQDTLLQTTKGQLELAQARQSVGAATILDVRRAEVAYGQAEVALLQARNTAAVEMLRLYERLGVPMPGDVSLTTRFPVAEVTLKLDSLVDVARVQNPGLLALRSRERAADLSVHAQQGQYAPTLFLRTGVGGNAFKYTNSDFPVSQYTSSLARGLPSCLSQDSIRVAVGMPSLGCATLYAVNPSVAASIRDDNERFNYVKAPISFSASLSLPIFDNLNREQRVQSAKIQRDNTRFSVRARELQLRADVTQAYLNLVTARRTVELQEVNAARAREELSFAEERYRVGAATFLDVTTSRGTFEQAQIDRLNAIYDYHKAFAALESAVGRSLR